MAMVAGTVTVADDGTVTATANSMAEAIFNSFVNNFEADTGVPLPAGDQGTAIKKGIAVQARRLAAICTYMQTFGQLQVLAADAGLQKDNTGGNPLTLARGSNLTFGKML